MPWKLTVRAGSEVEHSTFDRLDEALSALESRGRELTQAQPRRPLDTKVRRFEPAQLISARLELAGPERLVPRVRAGVDVRGDGSTEAYLGRVRRQLIEERGSETTYAALRRALGEASSG